jgi:hypothetical protein
MVSRRIAPIVRCIGAVIWIQIHGRSTYSQSLCQKSDETKTARDERVISSCCFPDCSKIFTCGILVSRDRERFSSRIPNRTGTLIGLIRRAGAGLMRKQRFGGTSLSRYLVITWLRDQSLDGSHQRDQKSKSRQNLPGAVPLRLGARFR